MPKLKLVLAAIALLSATPAAAAQDASLFGTWRNPKNSVHVDIRPCAQGACGYVVWASEKAKRDAREGGTPNLIGLQLFREFQPRKNGVWQGKVFVPDLNRTFSGQAEPIDAQRLRAKGCFIGNILCKTQVWTRIEKS
ncbi:MAG: DUF2147 domain-containing protein [Phenylobacterium sp.]|uniref:DUF2147 domain-containing protein n=1 Tax=Phenylobacterium sp. TaxID=1871053 RepID=UPI001A62BA9B|nr:DUF2147 domain-containing protein [Phenylobacterium sp.]MBL8769882.1 DUF2147 domain-containing protein [Phenylobacterium sp.]